jgi:hypothetical protein
MSRFAPRTILIIAAACWLAAGPGGVVVKAALACHHASALGQHTHMGHGARTPGDGPCFCGQMVGVFDQVVSVAVPPVVMAAQSTVSPIVSVADPSPFPLPPSPAVIPETPPPIVA